MTLMETKIQMAADTEAGERTLHPETDKSMGKCLLSPKSELPIIFSSQKPSSSLFTTKL